jgi:hypothetical protein
MTSQLPGIAGWLQSLFPCHGNALIMQHNVLQLETGGALGAQNCQVAIKIIKYKNFHMFQRTGIPAFVIAFSCLFKNIDFLTVYLSRKSMLILFIDCPQ